MAALLARGEQAARRAGADEEAAKHADCCVDREEMAALRAERDALREVMSVARMAYATRSWRTIPLPEDADPHPVRARMEIEHRAAVKRLGHALDSFRAGSADTEPSSATATPSNELASLRAVAEAAGRASDGWCASSPRAGGGLEPSFYEAMADLLDRLKLLRAEGAGDRSTADAKKGENDDAR